MGVPHAVAALVLLCLVAIANAHDELNTVYATTQPTLNLSHRDARARELEPILTQHAHYLIGKLHPWEKDPRALLIGRGGTAEADIRPNSHT